MALLLQKSDISALSFSSSVAVMTKNAPSISENSKLFLQISSLSYSRESISSHISSATTFIMGP